MKYTVLGRSGISVSRISMGTHHLNDPADMDKHVQNFLYAYKKGINFFETSVTYGEGYSELILGEAVTRAYASSFWETRDGAFFRFVRIAGLHIKTNTGGRNEHPQKITEKE